MNKEDYEKYYQKGGSYVIPVEIFNELFFDYECFKNDCQKYKEKIDKLNKKLEEYRMNIVNGTPYVRLEVVLNQQKEFIEYLESEKDILARECSHIYENSLGKTRLVNEDIFNEVDKILSKYKEIIGENNE